MGLNAAQYLMNQAPFHSSFPILVITKIFEYTEYKKLNLKLAKRF